MIRVTMELVPGGYGEPEHLGTMEFGNNVLKTIQSQGTRGDYDVEIWKKRKGRKINPWMKLRVYGYPRLAYHPWELVRRALNDAAARNGGHL